MADLKLSNAHMMMLEKNNLQIAELITSWLSRNVEPTARGASTVTTLKGRARDFETAMTEETFDEQIAAARSFHIEFWNICPNHELVEMILELRDRIPAPLLRAWHSRPRMEKSVEQHYKMVQALADRDILQLKAVSTEHMLGNRPDLS